MRLCDKCKEPRCAGQAFTGFTCKICGQQKMWHNTGVPKICSLCAFNTNRCMRCGEEITP